MKLTVCIDPKTMIEPMTGNRFAVMKHEGGWFFIARPASRNVIAQADTAEELMKWCRKQGGKPSII